MRNDLHKPSLADPAEYTFCAAFYQGNSDAMYEAYRWDFEEYDEWIEWSTPDAADRKPLLSGAKKPGTQVFPGNYAAKRTCDHCGAAFNHGVLFLHKSGDLVHVGHICAANTLGLPSKAAAAKKRAEKAAAAAKALEKQLAATEAWRAENAETVAWLNTLDTATCHNFLADMVFTLNKWGALSERQLAATLKFKAAAEEFAAKKATEPTPEVPLAAGRYEMTGTVKSTKYQHSDYYGETLKMLVELDDLNRVWGTVPASIDTDTLVGSTVEFTATVTKSDKDDHFGFFKRPTGATVLTAGPVGTTM